MAVEGMNSSRYPADRCTVKITANAEGLLNACRTLVTVLASSLVKSLEFKGTLCGTITCILTTSLAL